MFLRYYLPFFSSLLLFYPSVLAIEIASDSDNQIINHPQKISQNNTPEIPDYVRSFVKKITVEITTNNNRGSGTLIARKQGNNYLVLTNFHVINGSQTITLKTHDGKTYNARILNKVIPENYDLALIEFTSEQDYPLPSDDITAPMRDNPVISGGYMAETGEFLATEGKITHNLQQSFQKGYSIGYSNSIKQGMSGGPIVNSMGALVGINGRSAYPILNTGYIYENGNPATDEQIKEYRQVSWGIPINTLLTHVKPNILNAYGLPLPQGVATVEQANHTGYLRALEAKAQKFIVRIDYNDNFGNNGSGVIIAKEGNTYTVLSADHVLCQKVEGNCIPHDYTFTTHDGKTRNLDKSTIIRQEGVDLAVFSFESKDNYPVAQLADYNPNSKDPVFAAGFPKVGQNDPKWFFSGGRVKDKETGLLNSRQSDFDIEQSGSLQSATSLTGGYELVYTSITYGGMSGGAVLDAQGRVIGIHGRSEGVGGGTIQLGYSLGIPVSTFVRLKERLKVKSPLLTTSKPQVGQQEKQEIINAIDNTEINTQGNATAKVWIEKGGQLWRLRRYQEAVEVFNKAIEQNKPNNVYLAWYGKGLALGNLGDYQGSIEALEQAVNTLPSPSNRNYYPEFHSSIFKLQSLNYRYLKEPKNALNAINKAINKYPENPNLYNEKGVILLLLHRNDEAIEALNQGIKQANRAVLYNNRGRAYYNNKQLDLALADFNKAIELNPNFALIYSNRGILYQAQKKCDLALADYNKVIELNSDEDYVNYAHKNKGLCYKLRALNYVQQRKWGLALADYDTVIEIHSRGSHEVHKINLPSDYVNRGYVHATLQKFDLALADYNKAIELDPTLTIAYINRAGFYRKQQKIDLALADYSKVVELDPKNVEGYSQRVNLYIAQKQWELALADLNQIIKLDNNHATAYHNRGVVYREFQELELALADLNQAIKLDNNYASAYYNRAGIYRELQELELALADLNQAIKLDNNYASAYYNRAEIYLKSQELELALADLNQAIKLDNNHANAYYNRGKIYQGLQKWQLALADFNKSIELNPFPPAYVNRGAIYGNTQQWQLALADFNKAIELDPNYDYGYLNRGQVFLELGQINKAKIDLKKAAELFRKKGNMTAYENLMKLLQRLGN